MTLPANFLQPGKTYQVALSYFRVSEIKTTKFPMYWTVGAFNRTTRLNIRTTTGALNGTPKITGYRIASDGRFEVDVMGTPGRTIKLQASNLGTQWSTAGSGTFSALGTVTLRDSLPATMHSQLYRARSE